MPAQTKPDTHHEVRASRKRLSINQAIRALEDLDIGLPVEVGGMEYILIDKLYQRAPVHRGDELVGHRLLGVDMKIEDLLMKFSSEMTAEERFSIAARRTLLPGLMQRHSIFEMLIDARRLRNALQNRGPVTLEGASVLDARDEAVAGSVVVFFARGLSNDLSYGPEDNFRDKGARIDRFEVYLSGRMEQGEPDVSRLSDLSECQVVLGVVDLDRGFIPNPELPGQVLEAAGLSVVPEAELSAPSLG